MLVLVVVALQLVRCRQVCFARRQQILAAMHHVPSKMVLLPMLVIVRAARVIALPPVVCFAHLQ
mgnify:CR=1 FL=1